MTQKGSSAHSVGADCLASHDSRSFVDESGLWISFLYQHGGDLPNDFRHKHEEMLRKHCSSPDPDGYRRYLSRDFVNIPELWDTI